MHLERITEASVHKADESPALRRLSGDAEVNVKLHIILLGWMVQGRIEEGDICSSGARRESGV